jgi:hypothetical protein
VLAHVHRLVIMNFTSLDPKRIVGGLFFFRFVCLAIVSPFSYPGLFKDPRSISFSHMKLLVKVSKMLQVLARDKTEIEDDPIVQQFFVANFEKYNSFIANLVEISL